MNIKHEITKRGTYFRLYDDNEDEIKTDAICSALTYLNELPLECIIKPFKRTNKCFIRFCNFGTNHAFRHKGYGRKLLQDVKEYYKGCIVYLLVSSIGEMSNKDLINFYASEGFKLIENYKNYTSYPTMVIEL